MANQDCVKHIVTGGYWQDSDGRCVRAGENVISAFRDSPVLQQVLGLPPQSPEPTPGAVLLPPQAKRSIVRPEDTHASHAPAVLCSALFTDHSSWIPATSVVSQSHDVCRIGSWAVIRDLDGRNVIGNILEILAFPQNHSTGLVTFEKYAVGAVRHPHLGMPLLRPETEENSPGRGAYCVVPSASVLFIVNVQHDCQAAGCPIAASGEYSRQEREQTDLPIVSVSHKAADRRFIVNTHALHNAALLRQFLPRTLVAPIPLYSDRMARHHELAAGLRVTEAKKRDAALRKRQATQAKKAAASAAGVPTIPGDEDPGDADGDSQMVHAEHMEIDGEEPSLLEAESQHAQIPPNTRGSKRRRVPDS
ncbi:hypothetical protein OH76DRAFT_1419777 [Lentinus brumalis]|uniref:Uncharacterized protein n=1 Tax=Lentinus brumalis TaxID=2498619 RepID=A0A371D3H1_9APHY|nr:hypothetical protein OH76DRAFT_1419777 [Polyporus brumalis]